MVENSFKGLVSSSWLRKQLQAGVKGLRILDASWTPLRSCREDYVSKCIPGAQLFDLNEGVLPSRTIPRNLPAPLAFQEYVRSLGVSADSLLVVYDRQKMYTAARTWWTFRVFGHKNISVLDGGLAKWEADGFETSKGMEESRERGDFEVNARRELVAEFEDMVNIAQSGSCQIVDVRRPVHFHGMEQEPSKNTRHLLVSLGYSLPPSMHRGCVPGSRNLSKELLRQPDTGCLPPKAQLLTLFEEAGVDLRQPLVSMCYGGHSACLLALAAHICGKDDVKVYYGSWTEYGQRAKPTEVTIKESNDE